ncbi:MAG: hypothetical protein QG580_242 [Patescibacteria group bacterium]|jgi:uncharacterized protein (DUF305 family)|nr:hypothetical protein [Patescibacteria group bacterium]
MDIKYIRFIVFVLVIVALVFVLNKKTVSNEKVGHHVMSDGTVMKNGDTHMHGSMMVSNDQEFLAGMIPHHEEAVLTAKIVLEKGGTFPEIKTLAENIIVAQEKEIEDMKSWYKEITGDEYKDSGNYDPMMRDLSNLSKEELDKTFLEDMVVHHMGAIMMAEQALDFSENENIKNLSREIVKSQSEEIKEMRNYLISKFK